jgi:hypothetical protein
MDSYDEEFAGGGRDFNADMSFDENEKTNL